MQEIEDSKKIYSKKSAMLIKVRHKIIKQLLVTLVGET